MATRWFVSCNGEVVGPVQASELVEWVTTRPGLAKSDLYVRDEAASAWAPLEQSPFASLLVSAAASPTPAAATAAAPASNNLSQSLATMLVLLVAGYGVWYFVLRDSSAPEPPAARVVELKELLDSYAANEVAANATYKGSRVRVSGTVERVGEALGSGAYVVMKPLEGYSQRNAQLSFDQNQKSRVAAATVGTDFTADCTVRGLMLSVQMDDCR